MGRSCLNWTFLNIIFVSSPIGKQIFLSYWTKREKSTIIWKMEFIEESHRSIFARSNWGQMLQVPSQYGQYNIFAIWLDTRCLHAWWFDCVWRQFWAYIQHTVTVQNLRNGKSAWNTRKISISLFSDNTMVRRQVSHATTQTVQYWTCVCKKTCLQWLS